MTYLSTIHVDILMCLALLPAIIVAGIKLDKSIPAHRHLVAVMTCVLILLVLEACSVALDANFNGAIRDDAQLVPFGKLVNSIGFLLVPVPAFLAWTFLHHWTGVRLSAVSVLLWALPLACNAVLALLSYDAGLLFSIAPDNTYSRGPWFAISPAVFYGYQALAVSVLVRQRNRLRAEEAAMFALALALPAVTAAIQLHYFTFLTIWSSWAISCIILLVTVFINSSERDELTKLANRTAYRNAIAKARRMRELKMCVALLDMDGLKAINDRHGHAAGDTALLALAEGLRETFDEGFSVMRFGGDEFAVVQFDNDPAALYERLCTLENTLAEQDATSGRPYRVAFSYGLACSRDDESVDALLKRCDTLMYDRKRQKHLKAGATAP
ncbi:GGDEF domain-containing protein [Nitratidesulfovibrio termitidis]|uniref:GGDEF domain-containing protein n=1 Tax=Nitratidesulfovibrio termitidis TaxID=42252 RepID=UPI0004268F63|nr:GGDEF domain-containing protein [Nitratidesulfovibrio termitidis]